MIGFNVVCWQGFCQDFFISLLDTLKSTEAKVVAFVINLDTSLNILTDITPGEMGYIASLYADHGFKIGLKFHIEPANERKSVNLNENIVDVVQRFINAYPKYDFVIPFNETPKMFGDKRINGVLGDIKEMGVKVGIGINWDDVYLERFFLNADIIGISAYWTVSDSDIPTTGEVLGFWRGMLDKLTYWKSLSKEVWFSEIGYRSILKAGFEPWDYKRSSPPSEEAQARLYEGFLTFKNTYSFPDVALFWLLSDENSKDGYNPLKKSAWNVIKSYSSKPSFEFSIFSGNITVKTSKVPTILFIFDISGRVVEKYIITSQTTTIPLNLKPGVYIAFCSGKSKKFIVR